MRQHQVSHAEYFQVSKQKTFENCLFVPLYFYKNGGGKNFARFSYKFLFSLHFSFIQFRRLQRTIDVTRSSKKQTTELRQTTMATAANDGCNMQGNNLETFALLWLDAEVNTSEENRQAQQQIRSIINHVLTFEDPSQCQQYINSVCPHDRLVLIVSGRLGQEVVPRIHHARQLSSIYVYCSDKKRNEQWAKDFTKVLQLSY